MLFAGIDSPAPDFLILRRSTRPGKLHESDRWIFSVEEVTTSSKEKIPT
jgi:hypothetical protein